MSTKTIVHTDNAPSAIGPYSQANIAGNFVFVSGQLGFDPATMILVEGGVEAQARQALTNLTNILAAAGCGLGDVVNVTVYLKSMDDFALVNGVYAEFFTENHPSRAAIEVARLPKDGLVEIACIALKP